MKRTASLLVTLCLLQSAYAATSVPDFISFQGRALTATGSLIGTGTPVNRTVTFRVWDHASNSLASDLIYSETQIVTIAEGEFSVLIGAGAATGGTPLGYSETAKGQPIVKISDAFGSASRYLGVTIDDGTSAADNEISPRQQFVTSSFAMRAKVAEAVDGLAITTAMLANNAVTTSQVSDSAITTSKLAANAVTATQIVDATITTTKIAAGAITAVNLAAGSVTSTAIADGAIGTVDIADGAITGAKIATNTIPLVALVDAVKQALCPVGSIMPYAGDTAPAGWVLGDGTLYSRTTYAALFAVMGTHFGYGDSTNFRVPDLRGRFLRGVDGGAGRDGDRLARTSESGGASGDSVGSVQADVFASHTHPYNDIYFSEAGGDTTVLNNAFGCGNNDHNNSAWQLGRITSATGGNETRPKNVNVNYIIKY